MKEKEEPERERSQSVKSYSGVSQKFFPPNRLIVLTNPSDSTEALCKQMNLAT